MNSEREDALHAAMQQRRPRFYVNDNPDGPLLSVEALSAMIGVPPSVIRDEFARQAHRETFQTPKLWIEWGRQRALAYRQATGNNDLDGVLNFYSAGLS